MTDELETLRDCIEDIAEEAQDFPDDLLSDEAIQRGVSLAFRINRPDVVRTIIETAPVETLDSSVLISLTTGSHPELLSILLERVDPNILDDTDFEVLADRAIVPAVVKLVEAGLSDDGQTALLHHALGYNADEIARTLLERDVEPPDDLSFWYILHEGAFDITVSLLKAGVDVHKKRDGRTIIEHIDKDRDHKNADALMTLFRALRRIDDQFTPEELQQIKQRFPAYFDLIKDKLSRRNHRAFEQLS